MRDVSRKIVTLRTAAAKATLNLAPATVALVREGKVPKGNPLEVAKVAAVQAAKSTSQIIPYCHPVPVDAVDVEYSITDHQIELQVTVKAIDKTGVEMEALTAASVAALTLYDMLKAHDESMEIVGVRLLHKTGGRTDFTESSAIPLRAAVLVISDSVAVGTRSDQSGRKIVDRLNAVGIQQVEYKIVPDKPEAIEKELLYFADERGLDLVLTTGGTGLGPRDGTPEATSKVIEREVPGIAEAVRAYGQERTPYSMLSRARAGIRKKTLIINLPGSPKGVAESLDALFPGLLHAFKMLAGEGHPSSSADEEKVR